MKKDKITDNFENKIIILSRDPFSMRKFKDYCHMSVDSSAGEISLEMHFNSKNRIFFCTCDQEVEELKTIFSKLFIEFLGNDDFILDLSEIFEGIHSKYDKNLIDIKKEKKKGFLKIFKKSS
jgi:hypothetical protein